MSEDGSLFFGFPCPLCGEMEEFLKALFCSNFALGRPLAGSLENDTRSGCEELNPWIGLCEDPGEDGALKEGCIDDAGDGMRVSPRSCDLILKENDHISIIT